MFMVISALEYNGVIFWMADKIINAAGSNIFLLCLAVLWASAILSSILDNIPFVIAMVPLIKEIITYFANINPSLSAYEIGLPIWWSLALGACLGGNGTLIGASANVVMAKIAERNNYYVSFRRFSKYGIFFMIQSMILSSLYIWFRYFFLKQ